MTTDIYKISNSKTICRLLPFFARGRKLVLFLEAVAAPLVNLHRAFLKWAYRMLLKTKMTAQTDVIIWYLNYLFREHFYNGNDSFAIDQDIEIDNLLAFNYREVALFKLVGTKIFDTDEQSMSQAISRPVRDMNSRLQPNAIIIFAPKLREDENYTETDYINGIIGVINEYKTYFGPYVVEINEN